MDTTLAYIEHRGRYLMLYRNKKDADPNAGKWVGVGGKFAPGESAEDCLVREVREETGWELASWDYRGIVHFVNDLWPSEEMYLFTATLPEAAFAHEEWPLPACDEGTFAWIPVEEVPALPLWEGDRIFLAQLASGEHGIDLTLVYHGDELVDVRKCGTIDVCNADAGVKGGHMKIVTIDREYAAGGHTVGLAVAERLGVEVYDRDIIKNAAASSGIAPDQLEREEELLSGGTSFLNAIIPVSFDVKHVVFENECRAILDFAAQGPCVIIGRCAFAVLKDAGIPAVNVYLHASPEDRLARAGELLGMTDEGALIAAMKKVDKQRKAYVEYYTDRDWTDMREYDLCLDTGKLGYEYCIETICKAALAE